MPSLDFSTATFQSHRRPAIAHRCESIAPLSPALGLQGVAGSRLFSGSPPLPPAEVGLSSACHGRPMPFQELARPRPESTGPRSLPGPRPPGSGSHHNRTHYAHRPPNKEQRPVEAARLRQGPMSHEDRQQAGLFCRLPRNREPPEKEGSLPPGAGGEEGYSPWVKGSPLGRLLYRVLTPT